MTETNKGVVWTEEVIKTFLKVLRDNPGITYTEVAQIMSDVFNAQFTKNSVIGKARRLRLEAEEIKKDEPVTIEQLEWGMCKWPFGEQPPYEYCGLPTGDLGCSWCPIHRKIVWTKSNYR